MKKAISLVVLLVSTFSFSQVGIGTTNPNASSQLEVSSTTKGFLPPRMTTTQRDAIVSPVSGLVLYNTTTNALEFRSNSGWVLLKTSSDTAFLPTIVIGKQHWMQENLNVLTYRNGDVIPYVSDPTAWAALTTGAWCYYANDVANGAVYGKLYNWYAVNDSRGLAPTGWHIPTDTEWNTLITTIGGSSFGGKLKSVGATWSSTNDSATNDAGFTGLPGGFRSSLGVFHPTVREYGGWWSSTLFSTTNPYYFFMYFYNGTIDKYSNYVKKVGFSVRCVRD